MTDPTSELDEKEEGGSLAWTLASESPGSSSSSSSSSSSPSTAKRETKAKNEHDRPLVAMIV